MECENLKFMLLKYVSICEESRNERTAQLAQPSETKRALLLPSVVQWLDAHGSKYPSTGSNLNYSLLQNLKMKKQKH